METARKAIDDLEGEWVTLEEASRQLGQTRLKTQTQIIARELVGMHIAKRTVVRQDSIDVELARRTAANESAVTDALVTAQDSPEHSRQNVANGLGAGDESRMGG